MNFSFKFVRTFERKLRHVLWRQTFLFAAAMEEAAPPIIACIVADHLVIVTMMMMSRRTMIFVMTGSQMIPTRIIPAKFPPSWSIYLYWEIGPLALPFFIVAMMKISSVDGRCVLVSKQGKNINRKIKMTKSLLFCLTFWLCDNVRNSYLKDPIENSTK